MFSIRSAAVAASFLVAAILAGPTSAATQIFIRTAGMYAPETVKIVGGGLNGNYYASAVKFEANRGDSALDPAFELYGFCVDLFHPIPVGINKQKAVDLHYHVEPLDDDAHGAPLSVSQIRQIAGLTEFGVGLIRLNQPGLGRKLAAVQAAIWKIEYPTFQITPNRVEVKTLMNQYLAAAPDLTATSRTIYADNYATQAFATPGVPEPATWAIMIGGFGAVGFALRRRAALPAAA